MNKTDAILLRDNLVLALYSMKGKLTEDELNCFNGVLICLEEQIEHDKKNDLANKTVISEMEKQRRKKLATTALNWLFRLLGLHGLDKLFDSDD